MVVLSLSEFDQAGDLIATYSSKSAFSHDIFVKRPELRKSSWQQILDVFLPAGYPMSVADDYKAYQVYNSLQAFSSSIAGMLAYRAVLEGIGVGDRNSHPTTAILLSILQDSFGRLATILFANRLGSALEPECKMWRLAADVFNDAAMVMDCLSPAVPYTIRIVLLSTASVLRALCGVAAGSAKASLGAHFATAGNLGEVNAKGSSQETVISLAGMLMGSLVVAWVSSPIATWCSLITLLGIHLSMNYAAVRSVRLPILNRQRANLVFSHLLAYDKVLSPSQVSRAERIFERDGALRWADGRIVGFAHIGVGVQECLNSVSWQEVRPSGKAKDGSTALCTAGMAMQRLMEVFKDESYALWIGKTVPGTRARVHIMLKQGCSAQSQLKAWFHGLMLVKEVSDETTKRPSAPLASAVAAAQGLEMVSSTLDRTSKVFDDYCLRLRLAGWELGHATLETHAGRRFVCL